MTLFRLRPAGPDRERSWQDGTPVAGQQFEYAFDDIGNRTATPSHERVKGSVLD